MLSKTFDHIYKNEIWSTEGLGSGTGSSLKLTTKTREILSDFIITNSIRSMIDAPCGKMNWMPLVLNDVQNRVGNSFSYLGLDIVEDVIKEVRFTHQNSLFSKIRLEFKQFDMTKETVPGKTELLHCRDTLQHLSFEKIVSVLENFAKTDFKWIFLGSYLNAHENINIESGGYFSINLLDPPFSLPTPLRTVSEETHLYSDEPEKFYVIYDQITYKKIDFDAMRRRIKN